MNYQGNRGSQRRENAEDIVGRAAPATQVREIIFDTTAVAVQKLDEAAKKLGGEIKPTVTTSQIRGIFSLVREIEQETLAEADEVMLTPKLRRRLAMLRPKLAYQVGRIDGYPDDAKKAQMGALTLTLTTAVDAVLEANTVLAFRNFMDFFEAILAYHKFFGGQDKAKGN